MVKMKKYVYPFPRSMYTNFYEHMEMRDSITIEAVRMVAKSEELSMGEIRELYWRMWGIDEGGVFESTLDDDEDDVRSIDEHDKWQE